MAKPIPFNRSPPNDDDSNNKESLGFAKKMVALAKRGVDSPETLTLDEIQELSLTLRIFYAQMGVN